MQNNIPEGVTIPLTIGDITYLFSNEGAVTINWTSNTVQDIVEAYRRERDVTAE